MANDLHVEHDVLKTHHAMTVQQLTDAQMDGADVRLSFSVYKQAHEYVQLDTEKIKNELA